MDLRELYENSNAADEIIPGLWLGNRAASADKQFHKDKKIQAVFNCTKDIIFEESIPRKYRVPVDDSLQEPDIRNLELWAYEIVFKISQEMRKAREDGTAVLVHCAAGMQRSAASVAMYMISTQSMTTDQAVRFIQLKRPIAFRPKINFERSIRTFEKNFDKEIRPQLSATQE